MSRPARDVRSEARGEAPSVAAGDWGPGDDIGDAGGWQMSSPT